MGLFNRNKKEEIELTEVQKLANERHAAEQSRKNNRFWKRFVLGAAYVSAGLLGLTVLGPVLAGGVAFASVAGSATLLGISIFAGFASATLCEMDEVKAEKKIAELDYKLNKEAIREVVQEEQASLHVNPESKRRVAKSKQKDIDLVVN